MRVERHDELGSTQLRATASLAALAPGEAVLVHALRQSAGLGRAGRGWEQPAGTGVFVSVAVRGPFSAQVLDGLPRDCGRALLETIERCAPGAAPLVEWKEPNDLVAKGSGAKIAGILVDTLVVGSTVEHVIIGIGANFTGDAFVTTDGRHATSIAQLGGPEQLASDTVNELAYGLATRLVERVTQFA